MLTKEAVLRSLYLLLIFGAHLPPRELLFCCIVRMEFRTPSSHQWGSGQRFSVPFKREKKQKSPPIQFIIFLLLLHSGQENKEKDCDGYTFCGMHQLHLLLILPFSRVEESFPAERFLGNPSHLPIEWRLLIVIMIIIILNVSLWLCPEEPLLAFLLILPSLHLHLPSLVWCDECLYFIRWVSLARHLPKSPRQTPSWEVVAVETD